MNTAVKFPLPSRSLSPWGSHYQREFIRAASRGQSGNTHSPDAPHRCEGQRRPSPLASRPSLPAEVPRPGAAYLPGPPCGTATGHFSDTYRFPQEHNLHGFKFTSVNLHGFARRALKEARSDGHRRGLRCSEQCPRPQPCHPVPAGCPRPWAGHTRVSWRAGRSLHNSSRGLIPHRWEQAASPAGRGARTNAGLSDPERHSPSWANDATRSRSPAPAEEMCPETRPLHL